MPPRTSTTPSNALSKIPQTKTLWIIRSRCDSRGISPWHQCCENSHRSVERGVCYKKTMNTFFVFAAQYLFIVPIVVLGGYFFSRPRTEWMRLAFFAVPAGLLVYSLGLLANHLYFDPRPFVVGHFTPLVYHAPDNGFPSDHSLLVSPFATVGMFWNRRLGVVL